MAKTKQFKRFFGKYGEIFKDLRRGESRLDHLLLYCDFCENNHDLPIILNQDNSVMILFELEGIDYEAISPETREGQAKLLRNTFELLDPGFLLSNYLIRRAAKVPKLFIPDESPDVIKYMQNQKQSFWSYIAENSYDNRIICALLYRGKSGASKRKPTHAFNEIKVLTFLQSEIDERCERLYENFMRLKNSLSRYGFKTLSKEDVFSVLYELVNLDEAPRYRPEMTLNAQLSHSRLSFDRDTLKINDKQFCKVINIKYPPSETFAMLLRRLYGLHAPFVMKQIYEVFKFEGIEKKLNLNQNIAFSLSKFDKNCEHYVHEVSDLKDKVAGEKQACIYWNLTFYLYATSQEELIEKSYEIKNVLKELGSCGIEEVENLKYAYFGMFPGHEKLNRRNRAAVILSSNAGDLLSAYSLSLGDRDPVDYFLDRNNGIFAWNPFTSRENAWHTAITGPTGQGKSFFANRMILSSLVYQPFVYVIDLSRSFKELFELLQDDINLEAKILTFSRENVEFSMNPFLIEDERVGEEQLSFCEGLISLMCGSIVDDTNKIVIRESLEQFFEEYHSLLKNSGGSPIRPLDALIPIIEQKSNNENIKNKLKLWTYGNKGKLINTGIDNLKLARFCYFDIQNLDPKSEELRLIVYCLFNKIMTDVSKDSNRNIKKFLILDEAHHYLNIPEFEVQIDKIARTGRHYNVLLAILTQSINDLVTSREYSKGIINNLKQAFFFGGQKDIEDAFQMMQMDEYAIEIYNKLNIGRREILYWSSGGVRRVIRPITDNFTYWLATTHPSERYYRKLIRDEICDGDIKKAIETIIDVVAGATTQEEKESRLQKFIDESKRQKINNENKKEVFHESINIS